MPSAAAERNENERPIIRMFVRHARDTSA